MDGATQDPFLVISLPNDAGEITQSIESVRVGDRELPRVIEMTQRHKGEPRLHLFVRVEVIDGVPECRRVELRADPGGRQIRQVDLRDLNVADMVEMMAAITARRIVEERDGQAIRTLIEFGEKPYFEAVKRVRGARRSASARRVTPAFLEDVAKIYRDHFEDAPTRAVALAFNVGPRMASVYVQKAREAGYLNPTTRGKKGL